MQPISTLIHTQNYQYPQTTSLVYRNTFIEYRAKGLREKKEWSVAVQSNLLSISWTNVCHKDNKLDL